MPGIMRWSDRIARNTTSNEVVSTVDLLPTIAAITGAPLPPWTIHGLHLPHSYETVVQPLDFAHRVRAQATNAIIQIE